ncbi:MULTISPECIES: hypothetical protein [Pseudoalteromonas]|uniref:Uncharacterized protein n=1 Tax=Pseudoalteromonas luteoviolacea (strain 2ta16) TaxID=1353533 RepID=V4I2N7_PSEL2|nr:MULTISPECIES: hypothetical protein [Pseudoalteromonas]ESP94499.1 hypothetical protein PL2TA16_00499 [Pseudoalteromonas luteoviolacea 2ta16]KZN32194.1 hypothetical protein N483_03345 [Pseudoalteromonas luteoviolacea NCIMB 1944]MCG7547994.1 hypothetical protein [Pseudoalteromonas sp. Of7M-16]
MFKYSKVALGLATCFALTGCLEVEDDGNKEISNQLNSQNELLQTQIDLLTEQQENAKAPAAIKGTVVSVSEGVSAADAQVSVFVDNAWTEAVAVAEDGSFNIANLPAQRSIVVKVSSESGAFLTRHFKARTTGNVANGVQTADLYNLEVSEGYTKEIKVLDSESNEAIKNLTIWADDVTDLDRFWTVENFEKMVKDTYATKAVYNEEKGVYVIQLAKDLPVDLYYNPDLNGDGNDNYIPESGNYSGRDGEIQLSEAKLIDSIDVMYMTALNTHEFSIALTVLDEEGNAVEVKRVFANDNDRGEKYATYNEETKQYDLDANFFNRLSLVIPGFQKDDLVYSSANVEISYNTALSAYDVYNGNTHAPVELSNNTLNLVVHLHSDEVSESSVSRIATVDAKDTVDNDVQLYLNVPVEVAAANVQAMAVNHVLESKDGSTTLNTVETVVEHDLTLDLDNTRITITPKTEVTTNYRYRVSIDEVTNTISGKTEQLGFNREYNLPVSNAVFDINELTADNFNYTTNGKPIVAKNSAGVDDTWAWDYDGYVRFVLPKHLYLVEKLSFEVVKYTHNNVETVISDPNTEIVIGDGWSNHHTSFLAKIARNEERNGHFTAGGSAESGYRSISYTDLGLHLDDNKEGDKSSITINYSYQLKDSKDVVTGTLELPVQ